jgi:squalene synthase HpnC
VRTESFTVELERFAPPNGAAPQPGIRQSRAYCRRLARMHYENFRVASWLLPRHLRQHFCNVYAYCRWSDDLADETAGGQESLDLLDWWEEELLACYGGTPRHPVMVALTETIVAFGIPPEPFLQLLVAFRQDQTVKRYETERQLLEYCKSSANPVGRMVLYLGHCHDKKRGALADNVCTGLQLANFCQDVRRDWERGRIYLPLSTRERMGCREEALAGGDFDAAWRAALAYHVAGAQVLLSTGRELVPLVPRELQLDVWLFIEGGLAILKHIVALDYDVWTSRPTVSKREQLALLAHGCWLKTRGRLGSKTASATGAFR